MSINDLSVEADSGWRAVSPSRVEELVEAFVNQGLYGVGLLRRPRVVHLHGQPLRAQDGNLMLLDGKHTISTLRAVRAKMLAMVDGEESPVFTDALVSAVENGVLVDIVEFPDDDSDLRVAYCALAHDEASNRYKIAAIKDLVDVANRYHRKAVGGSWDVVREEALKIYGPARRTFVHRVLVAAQTLSKVVLDLLDRYQVPNSYIYDNGYFNGHGREAGKRLGDAWRCSVLEIFGEEVSKGTAFSKNSFESEYCVPAKHAEVWVKAQRRQYGCLAESPAFTRLESYLMSSQARPQILKCMRLGVRLEGSGPGSTGDAAGIDQCRVICDSLAEAKHRRPDHSDAGHGVASMVSEPEEKVKLTEEPSGSAGILTGAESEDTAHLAAKRKSEAELSQFLRHTSFTEMQTYLTRVLMPTEKVTFFVDFITSKARVPLSILDQIGEFLRAHGHGPASGSSAVAAVPPLKVRIFVPTGPRVDLVSAVQNKLAAVAPSLSVFFLTLTAGSMQGRKQPFFLVIACDQASLPTLQIPHAIEAMLVRARRGEGIRLRCLDANCALRSTTERQELEVSGDSQKPGSEIPLDHSEVVIGDTLEEEADEGAAPVVGIAGGRGGALALVSEISGLSRSPKTTTKQHWARSWGKRRALTSSTLPRHHIQQHCLRRKISACKFMFFWKVVANTPLLTGNTCWGTSFSTSSTRRSALVLHMGNEFCPRTCTWLELWLLRCSLFAMTPCLRTKIGGVDWAIAPCLSFSRASCRDCLPPSSTSPAVV